MAEEVRRRNKKKETEKIDWKQSVVLYLHDLLIMLAVIMIVFLLVFRVIVVSGSSMYSTLIEGDYLLLVSNLFYREPQYGDIIVASKESFDDGKPIIKRVIATEGQTVDIDFDTWTVTVDGKVLKEDYINRVIGSMKSADVAFPLTVPEGYVFVMGDNRNDSLDSRNSRIGFVDERFVLGEVKLRIFPLDRFGTVN